MGENGDTKIKGVLLAQNGGTYPTDATSDEDYTAEAVEYADVVVEDGKCFFEDFEGIKASARKLLSTGIKWGFGYFPIDRNNFRNKILSTVVTEENVCNVLLKGPDVDEFNHNKKRNWLKGHSINEKEAWEMGVKADQIQVKKVCDDDYDYGDSPIYAGVSSCQDVLDEIDGNGVPVIMYGVDMESAAARAFIDKPSSAPLYTDYGKGKPMACGKGTEGKMKYSDSYHAIPVVGTISIDFILHVFTGKRWSAWNNRTSCNGYQADHLKFNFGTRVFVPITVDEGNGPDEHAIVITSVAAASNMTADVLIPKNLPYHRTIGAETAKKVLIDAKAWDWTIK